MYIGRGGDPKTGNMSKWGNPYSHQVSSFARYRVNTREEAIAAFREWIKTQPKLLAALDELKGQTLGCWCKPKKCHGDVLAELADSL